MTDPSRCYAVVSGEYSDYSVLAIYRRREDALARCEDNNSRPRWVLGGEPVGDEVWSLEISATSEVGGNPERESWEDLRVEELDYYEGEPLPAPLEGS